MKIIKNINESWKTTVLGICFLIVGGVYLYVNEMPDSMIAIFLFTAGATGIIAPDKLINKLLKS
jgi:hypothetical protein